MRCQKVQKYYRGSFYVVAKGYHLREVDLVLTQKEVLLDQE